MPLYDYRCDSCNEEWEATHKVEARHSEKCSRCGNPATLLISTLARGICMEGYDEGLGEYVTGRQHKRKIMKAKGLEEV